MGIVNSLFARINNNIDFIKELIPKPITNPFRLIWGIWTKIKIKIKVNAEVINVEIISLFSFWYAWSITMNSGLK